MHQPDRGLGLFHRSQTKGGDSMKQIHPTREAWLEEAMSEVSVQFKRLGFPLPKKIRVTCGFTSGGTRKRPGGKVLIGECWDSSRSGDKSFEIMVSPLRRTRRASWASLCMSLPMQQQGWRQGIAGTLRPLREGCTSKDRFPRRR
jgi:hypothetical protein